MCLVVHALLDMAAPGNNRVWGEAMQGSHALVNTWLATIGGELHNAGVANITLTQQLDGNVSHGFAQYEAPGAVLTPHAQAVLTAAGTMIQLQ